MISPEKLRQFPFFGVFDDARLQDVAKAAEEISFEAGDCFYETDQPAEALYLLVSGSVENYLVVADPEYPTVRKEFYLGDIHPGTPFGLSCLIEPYTHSTTTRANRAGILLRIDAATLRQMCTNDPALGYLILQQLSQALKERLKRTRMQLAATRAN